MATLLIPTTPGVPFQTSKVRLEGRDFLFRLTWNQRSGRWYLAISDEDGVLLRAGIKLIANWPLLRNFHHDPRLPPGELSAFDLTSDGAPPGLDELGPGKRVELTYFESSST